jgi:hypothetical protein
MTDDERELLLLVARWVLRLESGAAADMKVDVATHPSFLHVRKLIAAVERKPETQGRSEDAP